MQTLNATLTRCRDGQPLLVLIGPPFNDLEIRPTALRNLAQQLMALAELATRLPTHGKHFVPLRLDVGQAPITNTAPAPIPAPCSVCGAVSSTVEAL